MTKKFKEINKCYILEFFSKCNDYGHQNTQYFLYLWNLINLFKKIYENVHLSVSYDFFNFDGSKIIKV
jgi:hypothetical protein